ncbi:UDP-3-O-(3-hydroxymyristoyl)glucosamine N-acyltransferase [Prochlorococcus marinus]|uniref:UDP-3-O-(3-hydroxymyristoyl)glucosamine N-acyltransferase n=1 Tax=Prochlorococcus marinus TaxID=1219 RepID=UPI0022B55C81|nr:UDP-3-O-(3-hydroxymyristoyl)glucosamine N-acyltransferase [Prochlorococcus marinus]
MKFLDIINILKNGESGVLEFSISNNPQIYQAASLEKATESQISFLEEGSYLLQELNKTNASALILPNKKELSNNITKRKIAWVTVKEPRIAFAEILEIIYPKIIPIKDIHNSAIIGTNVDIGEHVSIGANVTIASNCKINSEVIIHPGVVIYNDVTIGSGSELHSNCVLHPHTNIGKNCVIHSHAVIGSEGFGFIPTRKGWRKMPQTGKVIIQNNVEIGCGTTVDRPAVGETVIGAGTKIDNLVQIGHGVEIGKNCAMAAQVGIAGGAKIGDGVILAGQVGVGNRVNVGANVIASSKCGIHADIEAGQIISGFPAMPNKLWLRCSANFKRLPEIAKAIRNLNRSN